MGFSEHVENCSFYFAYKKSSLVKLCQKNQISNASRLSREELIVRLDSLIEEFCIPSANDLLKNYQFLIPLIVHEVRRRQEGLQFSDRVRETIIDLIGNSMSRLPCLVEKNNLSGKDINAIKANLSALENFHQFLNTSRICDPGIRIIYDPVYHDGPEALLPGQMCVPVSTGIRFKDTILLKALVTFSGL